MAGKSAIEWTDATWNPVVGCSPVSSGCEHCYAARMALRLSSLPNGIGEKYSGVAGRGPGGTAVFTGRIKLDRASLRTPLSWRAPRMIFVSSMSDLFHEKVPPAYIQDVFATIEEGHQHVFQVLTKRPEKALALADMLPWPENLWMGVTVENRAVLERIRLLQAIPAATRFLSCEPLLEGIPALPLRGIDWVIVGGESGPGARKMEKEWVLDIKDQCERDAVSFFFKQWGGTNKKASGRSLNGRTYDAVPMVG